MIKLDSVKFRSVDQSEALDYRIVDMNGSFHRSHYVDNDIKFEIPENAYASFQMKKKYFKANNENLYYVLGQENLSIDTLSFLSTQNKLNFKKQTSGLTRVFVLRIE